MNPYIPLFLAAATAVAAPSPAWAGGPNRSGPAPVAATPSVAPPASDPFAAKAASAKRRYEACVTLTESDPNKALARASAWHHKGGGLPADHCLALALVALKQYRDAATELERIASAMAQTSSPLRPEVLDQAGNAWLLAGDAKRAYGSFAAAVALAPENAGFLTDRARAALALGDNAGAARDLTMALRHDPTQSNLYILRAEARRKLGKVKLAFEDADTALALDPTSVRALVERGILREEMGDKAGAERDWLSVVRLAPNTAAAAEAQARIQTLALKPKK